MTPATPAAPPALLTAEEFARRYSGDYVELIDGRVEEIPMAGARHGQVCMRASRFLGGYVEDNHLGLVCSNDTFVLTRRDPDRVRGGDVCFWPNEKLPPGPTPDGLIEAPPDLVVEVRSPTDRWNDVMGKMVEYINAGVRVVVILDPKSETASVHRPDEIQQIYDNGDDLTLPDVLPGFAVPVKRFFE